MARSSPASIAAASRPAASASTGSPAPLARATSPAEPPPPRYLEAKLRCRPSFGGANAVEIVVGDVTLAFSRQIALTAELPRGGEGQGLSLSRPRERPVFGAEPSRLRRSTNEKYCPHYGHRVDN